MSGLLFLSTEDFQIAKGGKGNIMVTNIPGFSLLLFYSTQCQHCQNLIPIFKQLPGIVSGCQFGMINVSHNKECVLMSRNTLTEIKVVPYIILYINGKPYMRYQGPHDIKEISRFIVEVSQKVKTHQPTTQQQEHKEPKGKPTGTIPAYTIGKPLYGPDELGVCYLEFNDAYGTTNKNSNNNTKNRFTFPTGSGMN
jgi:hypothetical protein